MAALEWSLDAPITIRGEADIQSKRVWADRFEPYAHQVRNLITFCRRAPVALLADDVGLGKTISAGLILSELMVRKKVSRALVVAPKLLLPQWQEELAVKFGIPAEPAVGAPLAAAIRRGMPVVVSTYHSIRSYLDDIRRSNFDMIILDEAHKLRNLHGTAHAPQFAQGVHRALADRVFKYVLMLTATPIQNRIWDLYSLVDLLTAAKGHTNPLGTPEAFKSTYVEDARAVTIRRGRKEQFRQHLSNYIVRTRRSDAKLVFPTRRVRTHRVPASIVEAQLLRLMRELFSSHTLNGLSQSSVGQALMSSPQALSAQVQEMARNGTIASDFAERVAQLVTPGTKSGKLSGLTSVIRELSEQRPLDWRLVVFTSRKITQDVIGKHLQSLGIPTGFISGSRPFENERAIRAFKESPPGIRVLVSTDAGAEGVNLQVANVLINYDLPWNPMVLEQRIGRIQRLASTHAEVTVLNLVLAGSVEEKVVGRLGEKLQAISESIGDIEGILETAAQAGDDDDSFETMIRKLVVDSLRGLDVEDATRKAMESIQEAKNIFEAERETVETTLGDLCDLHRTGPRVPEITPVVPSIEARDFVLRALTKDGGQIRPVDGDVLAVSMPGQNEYRITFKDRAAQFESPPGMFGGNAPRLYLPGKRDFERLAQSWAEKSGALILDRSRPSDEHLEGMLKEWLARLDGFVLADFQVAGRREGFAGELTCRASVAVAHDRLEKLITVPVRTGVDAEIAPAALEETASADDCESARLGTAMEDAVLSAMNAEPDLTKFSCFYASRLKEELPAARDPARKRQLTEQFTAISAATAVAVKGIRYAYIDVAAQVRIDEHGPYAMTFTILPGAANGAEVIDTTVWTACEESGRPAPAVATSLCAITGKRALLHLLSPSAMSGQLALSSRMLRCEETQDLLLPSETEICSITGRRVRRGLLTTSAVSGRTALPAEFRQCELTGARVLPDELTDSAISGKKFRSDEKSTSILSGRVGHTSEFVNAALPAGPIASDEAAKSDMSGRWADATQLTRSEIPPHRRGLPEETARSEVSGKLVLKDELVPSDVSSRLALEHELEPCQVTGARCLPSELIVSAVSAKRFRGDQQSESMISHRIGHAQEFVQSVDPAGPIAPDEGEQSAVSGKWVQRGRLIPSDVPPHRRALEGELVRSVVSGKAGLPNEVSRSALSGLPALPGELEPCAFDGDLVLPDELLISDISGKPLRQDRVSVSAHSGRKGHTSEFVESVLPKGVIAQDEAGKSDLSSSIVARDLLVESEAPLGRMGLPTEIVVSAASGKRYLRDEVSRSAVSDSWAHPEELATCEFTSQRVLPSELAVSDVSSKRYRGDQKSVSVLSGRSGHLDEFVQSVLPSGLIAKDESARSDLSGKTAARQCMLISDAPTHRLGLPEEAVLSAATKKRYLRDEVVRSAISDSLAHPDELVSCEFTGAVVLPDELLASDVSGKRGRVDEMLTSVLGGRRGHSSEFVRSVAPTGWIARDEAAQSALSGEWGAKSSLLASARPPHRLGLAHELVECAVSRQRLLRDEVAPSAVSGKVVDDSLLLPSAASGKRAIAEEMVICEATGKRLLPSETSNCSISGKRVDVRELVRSDVSGLPGLASLMLTCPETGKKMLPSEATMCSVSGTMVLASETAQCTITGRHALRRLMQQCPTSGDLYLDDGPSRAAMKQRAGSEELLEQCQWTGKLQLRTHMGACSISGLRVAQRELNLVGELKPLRDVLDSDTAREARPLVGDSLTWLRLAHQDLKGAQAATAIKHPDSRVVVVAVRTKSGLLGLSTSYYALAATTGKPPVLLCKPVGGKRSSSGWRRG